MQTHIEYLETPNGLSVECTIWYCNSTKSYTLAIVAGKEGDFFRESGTGVGIANTLIKGVSRNSQAMRNQALLCMKRKLPEFLKVIDLQEKQRAEKFAKSHITFATIKN